MPNKQYMRKIIQTAEIGKRLKATFGLSDWNPTDPAYLVVSRDDISAIAKMFPSQKWVESKWECEEIAKAFVVDVRRMEAQDGTIDLNRAIGVANCSRLSGDKVSHTVNIAISQDDIFLLDMQTGEYHVAEKGKDEVFFVEM